MERPKGGIGGHLGLNIGIDLQGSDAAPEILFEGVIQAAKNFKDIKLYAISLESVLPRLSAHPSIQMISVQEQIEMTDEPVYAARKKKGASMLVGIDLLSKKKVDAFITAGNTGALLTACRSKLEKLWKKRTRPALLTILPTIKGPLMVLDVGGIVHASSEHLIHYAEMGAAYFTALFGKKTPNIGLLNIGVESTKGPEEVRKAYSYLKAEKSSTFSFVGNIEGREVFGGSVDVLVTDGFTGNVFLKTVEGASNFVLDSLRDAYQKTHRTLPLEIIQTLEKQFCHDEYPGALVCGVKGVVIKCHGSSTAKAMFHAIDGARKALHRPELFS